MWTVPEDPMYNVRGNFTHEKPFQNDVKRG